MNKKEHFPIFLGVFLDYYLKCGYKVDTAIKMAVAKTKKLMLVIDEASKGRRISEIKEETMPAPDPKVTDEYLRKTHNPFPMWPR